MKVMDLCGVKVAKLTFNPSSGLSFVKVPAATLPGGIVVPAFTVGQYLAAKGPQGTLQVRADGVPWVNIDYHGARLACAAAGLSLLTELQALAIAQDIARQPLNWTSGMVGIGKVFQGLHKGWIRRVQSGQFVSPDPEERRWHVLSNGQHIYDFSGNAFSWVFDNVQGNELGVVARPFARDSPSISSAPEPSMEHGMGWWPSAHCDWSRSALARGGCFESRSGAGVFVMIDVRPVAQLDYVGFRCTRPG